MRKQRNLWVSAWQRLTHNRLAAAGAIFVAVTALVAIFAPIIAPYNPIEQNYEAISQSPNAAHLMGTDYLGRDVLSRLVFGARTSLLVGIFTQFLVLIIGLPIGSLSALAGGRIDNLLMRFTDIIYAFPDLLLIILFRSIFGGSIYMIFLAIGLVAWCDIARLVRGQILSLKEKDFVAAARASGASDFYITLRHLLPNCMGPVIVTVTFLIPRAIFAEAALSYIGIGVRPPMPSWGTMIRDGQALVYSAPHLIVFPAIAIAAITLAFVFLGDGLRDALDPRFGNRLKRRTWGIY